MKKIFVIITLCALLAGCSAAETFETVDDVYSPQTALPMEVTLTLPEDAAQQVIAGDTGRLYFGDGYEIAVETLAGGDLDNTLRALTGCGKDDLTLLKTEDVNAVRYSCAWTAVGESGDVVGRTVILDDGNYHYCLTVTAQADTAGELQSVFEEIFDSYALASY